jgi:hypothetical protein
MKITEDILTEIGFMKYKSSDEFYYVLPNNHRINLQYYEDTESFWGNINYEPPGFPIVNLSEIIDVIHKNAVRFGENKKLFEIKTILDIR